MELADVLRYAAFVIFGLGAGLMVATNVVAFNVLRPPQKLGFLWWHVSSISLSFLCLGTVALDRTMDRLGDPLSWQVVTTFVGLALFAVAQIIIFNVERSRLTAKQAVRQAGLDPADAVFDPATQETGMTTHTDGLGR